MSEREQQLVIYKYLVPLAFDAFTIQMPRGAQPLSCQMQEGSPVIWCMVDPDEPLEETHFRIIETGKRFDAGTDMVYVGTFQMEDYGYVLHLFQEWPDEKVD